MDYEWVFDACRELAWYYGHREEKAVVTTAIYMDPYGCDFQIIYRKWPIKKAAYALSAYLGGRMVYSFWSRDPEREIFVDGRWIDLVSELRYRYTCLVSGDLYIDNHTLFALCKKEADQNRRVLDGYKQRCLTIMSKERDSSRKRYEFIVDGHELLVMKEIILGTYRVAVYFDGSLKFELKWGGKIGSEDFNNGRYVPGEWEQMLAELYTNLSR